MSSSKNRFEGLLRRSSAGVTVWHHHYITLSILERWMERVAYLYAQGVLLDYGCGAQPYRNLLAAKCTRYMGADVAAAHGVHLDFLFTPGEPLPIESQSFDTILSTQTLEHVEDVQGYMSECFRLLRPGGHLILTVPMQWRMHEQPYDYWRFTRHGVIALVSSGGLTLCDLSPCGGAWALVGQIINSHLAETGRGSGLIYGMINRLALWADRKAKDEDETVGWMCIAQRPATDRAHGPSAHGEESRFEASPEEAAVKIRQGMA
jgi:SAM-dependent methyltransferase